MNVLLMSWDEGGEERGRGGEEGAGQPDDGEAEDDGGPAGLGSQGPDYRLDRILHNFWPGK